MDFLSDFISWMTENGCEPANPTDIIDDDTRRYYQIAGDKPGSDKGSYCLGYNSYGAYGWARSHKQGETKNYSNRDKSIKLTAAQKIERDEANRKRRKEQEKQRQESYRIAAGRVKTRWESAKKAETHPYLTEKKVKPYGLRISGKDLLVPVMDGDELISLQFISPEGEKLFASGARTRGGYHLIPAGSNSDILVCEGYSTGATIHEITGRTVAVAFNAGNLPIVATSLKSLYPESRIVICADNDWEKVAKAKNKDNVGLEAGKIAVRDLGGAILIYPPDIPDCSDFNDMAQIKGHSEVEKLFKERLTVNVETFDGYSDVEIAMELPPIEAYSEDVVPTLGLYKEREQPNYDWKNDLLRDDKGKVFKTMNNTLIFMKHDEVLSNLFCYDEFCRESVVYRCPPWESPDKFNVRPLNDEDKTMLTIELENRGVVQPFATVERLLGAIIKENSRNPATEFFNSLVWDGTPRLDSWLTTYLNCTKDNQDYVSAVGRKWLVAAVARVFHAGTKFDHMLILEGKQRIGKSLALRELATFRGKSFFLDTVRIGNLGERDTTLKMQGKIIIEFAELTGMQKADIAALKQTITTQDDSCRLNYSNSISVFPRQFVFAGTYNPDGTGIFSDPTGNERFWVVEVGDTLDIAGLIRDKEQIWAEAVDAFKNGEKLYLEGDVAKKAQEAQEFRMSEVPWADDLEPLIHGRQVVYAKDIWKGLGVTDVTKKTKAFQNEICRVMAKNGFEKARLRRDGGIREYAWRRIDTRLPHEEPEPEEEQLEF